MGAAETTSFIAQLPQFENSRPCTASERSRAQTTSSSRGATDCSRHGRMRRAGIDEVARWREAGAWWSGESAMEHVQWRDAKGVLRHAERPVEYQKETENGDVRPRKTRDEKVAAANGFKIETWKLGVRQSEMSYVPLHVLSGYSFGRSVLLARELPRRAASLGIKSLAVTDRFALTGAVEFARECRECGIKPLIGVTVELPEGGEIVLIAQD